MSAVTHKKQMQLVKDEQARAETLRILEKGFQVADVFINRQYLDRFSTARILDLDRSDVEIPQSLRVFQLTKVAFDKEEDVTDKLTSIYNALYSMSVSVAVYIVGTSTRAMLLFYWQPHWIARPSPSASKGMRNSTPCFLPHAKFSYAYGENTSHAVSKGVTNSFTRSINESISNSNSSSSSYTEGTSYGSSSSSNFGGSSQGDGGSASWGFSSGTTSSTSSSYTSTTSFSHSISNSIGTAEAESTQTGESDTTGESKTKTLNYENKGISDLMQRIEEHLARINQWESYGLWESTAYFFQMRLLRRCWRPRPIRP